MKEVISFEKDGSIVAVFLVPNRTYLVGYGTDYDSMSTILDKPTTNLGRRRGNPPNKSFMIKKLGSAMKEFNKAVKAVKAIKEGVTIKKI